MIPLGEFVLQVIQVGELFTSDSARRVCFTSYSGWRAVYKSFRWEFFYKGFRLKSFLQVIQVEKLFKSGSTVKGFFQVIPVGELFTSDSAERVCFTSDSSWRAFYKWFKVDSILIRW